MSCHLCLLSYPKSGRTWLWYAAGLAITHQYGLDEQPERRLKFNKRTLLPKAGLPFSTSAHSLEPPQADHYVLLLRDPRDIITSAFYWRQERQWSNHVVRESKRLGRWARAWEGHPMPTFYYEDMHSDLGAVLGDFLKLLGVAHPDPESIRHAQENARFAAMQPQHPRKCRKGQVGDWKNHLTKAQEREVWAHCRSPLWNRYRA